MKTNKLVILAALALAPALGCGDDGGPGGGNGSGDSGTGSTGATSNPNPTTNADSDTGVATGSMDSGDSDSGGGESSSSGEPPPVEVTVSGQVVDFVLEQPIPGSEISIYDDDTLTATADDEGLFSIGTFEADTGALFVLEPNKTHWGAIIPVTIGSDPVQEDEELTQISNDIVDMQIASLDGQNPADPNLEQAILVVRLLNNTAVAEGPTTITMDPAPTPDTFYAPDENGAAVLNQNTIEFSLIPVVVYYNLEDTDPGTISITAEHPTRDCEVLYPDLPTIGRHMTLVDVQCLPAE